MEEIAEGVFVETKYDGVNVGAILTPDGFICVDAPTYPRDARDWVLQLHQLRPVPILYLILTDYHGDRILNAHWLNAPIIAHQATAEKLNQCEKRLPQSWLDSLLQRSPDRARDLLHSQVSRANVVFSGTLGLVKGEVVLWIRHRPGPTPGTVWVDLPRAGMLFTGDSLVVNTHPLLAEANPAAWLNYLERLWRTADPTLIIVPGRGPLTNVEGVQPVVAYIQQMRERVRHIYLNGRRRDELHDAVEEFVNRFPANDLPREWVQQQVRQSLDRLYDEAAESYSPAASEQPLQGVISKA